MSKSVTVMTIRDMFKKGFAEKYGDVDIINDVTDEFSSAFCGDIEFTEAGVEKYKDILDDEIEIDTEREKGCVLIDKYGDDWECHWDKINELFGDAAGYIADSEYKRLFREV